MPTCLSASGRRGLMNRSLTYLVVFRFPQVGIGVGVRSHTLVFLSAVLVSIDRLILGVALSSLAAYKVVFINLCACSLVHVVPRIVFEKLLNSFLLLCILLFTLERVWRVLGADCTWRLARNIFDLLSLERWHILQALVVIIRVVYWTSNLIDAFELSVGGHLLKVVASQVVDWHILQRLVDKTASIDIEPAILDLLRLRRHPLNFHLRVFSVAEQWSSVIIFVQIA